MNKFPENWHLFKLKDLSVIGDGAHVSIKRIEMGTLYLTSKNFGKDRLDLSKVDYISEDDYIKYFKKKSKALTRPESGDVLLGIIGTIGSPYLVKSTDKFGLSSSVSIIRADIAKIDPKYLYYWFKTPLFQNSLNQIKSGVAQSFLSLAMIGSLPCAYPQSLPTQQKIARILSAYNDLIENNLKRIKLLEEMAQLTYEEWFVRLKFPEHEKAVINSETGLPEGWEDKELKYFGQVITGKTPPTSIEEYYGSDVLFIKTPDMAKAPYVLDSALKLSTKGADTQKGKYLPKNTLLVSCIATAGVVALTSRPSQFNQQINAIVFNRESDAFFVYCFAKHLKPLLEALGSNGATMTNVNKSKFERIKVITPTEELLISFGQKGASIFSAIEKLLQQNQLLKEARDILLPRLMTGMINVESLELPETVANKTTPTASENSREASIHAL